MRTAASEKVFRDFECPGLAGNEFERLLTNEKPAIRTQISQFHTCGFAAGGQRVKSTPSYSTRRAVPEQAKLFFSKFGVPPKVLIACRRQPNARIERVHFSCECAWTSPKSTNVPPKGNSRECISQAALAGFTLYLSMR
jgi:hypothetical protein